MCDVVLTEIYFHTCLPGFNAVDSLTFIWGLMERGGDIQFRAKFIQQLIKD